MYEFVVNGGKKLKGEVNISGSKNATLPILATAILNENPVTFTNVPDIEDVKTTLKILTILGCKVTRKYDKITISSKNINKCEIPKELMHKCRSTVILAGALISRFNRAKFYMPGGCNIGKRPIDLHISAFKKLGIKVDEADSKITCNADRIKGNVIELKFPSVGATENIILASVYAKGVTQIINPAKEPEIIDLVNCLNKMGARITGAGSNRIKIFGVQKLRSVTYRVMPDRIEAGTFLCVSAITNSNFIVNNARAKDMLEMIYVLKKMGLSFSIKNNSIYVKGKNKLNVVNIKTLPYPGFPTDIGPLFASVLTKANGKSTIEETIFENRFEYCKELIKMNAKISISDRKIYIEGPSRLISGTFYGKDLRGGAAILIASLFTNGTTHIKNAEYILRGYEKIDQKLNSLGADVKLIKSS